MMNSISDFLVKEPSAGFYVGIPMLGLLWVLLAYGFMMADRILEREGYKREEVFRQETRQPVKRRTNHKRNQESSFHVAEDTDFLRLDNSTKQEIKAIMMEKHPLKEDKIIRSFKPILILTLNNYIEEFKILNTNLKKSDDPNPDKPEERMVVAKDKSKMGFLNLGYGFVTYFSFMEFMILLFTILTFLSLPSLYYFLTFRQNPNTQAGLMDKFSLANLGYSSTLCNAIHLEMGRLHMSCETGQMQELVSFGIIPAKSNVQDACYETEDTKKCEKFILREQLEFDVIDHCVGKRNCSVGFSKYIDKDSNTLPECFNENSRFYVQMICKVTETELEGRKWLQLILVWTIIITALIYFISIEWYGGYSQKYEDFDKSTTTSSDFTVEFKFEKCMYKRFKEHAYPLILEKRKENIEG